MPQSRRVGFHGTGASFFVAQGESGYGAEAVGANEKARDYGPDSSVKPLFRHRHAFHA